MKINFDIAIISINTIQIKKRVERWEGKYEKYYKNNIDNISIPTISH